MPEHPATAREVCSGSKIASIIERLATEITQASSEAPLAIVGIRTAGVPLATRIADAIAAKRGSDVLRGQLDCALYRDDGGVPAKSLVPLGSEITFDVDACRVVLVDDVFFTGRTVRAAIDQLMDFGRPERIELAILVDRRKHRQLPIVPDYVGMAVDTAFQDHVAVELSELHGVDRITVMRRRAEP